jgi:hypothetical protein
MSLQGRIAKHEKTLCFVYEDTMTFEPKKVRSFFAIRPFDRGDEDLLGREAWQGDWTVEVPLGFMG